MRFLILANRTSPRVGILDKAGIYGIQHGGLLGGNHEWYDPETGRWLSKDPIGIAGGLNLYAFCGNNPVNFVDPSGLQDHSGTNRGGDGYSREDFGNDVDSVLGGAITGAIIGGFYGKSAQSAVGGAITGAIGGLADTAKGGSGLPGTPMNRNNNKGNCNE